MSEQTVNEFLDSYVREFDYYQNAAKQCSNKIESIIDRFGIRAIVTYRAKKLSSLRVKLFKRNTQKNYKTIDEIREDVVDLAGVRIALYFPGDIKRIDEIICTEFNVLTKKVFPGDTGPAAGRIFSGYHASHYRVLPKDSVSEASGASYREARVEIQVGSVLMHAWSEVEHDLVYKPAVGEISEGETEILDELNGLVLAGNIALQRLQKASMERVLSKHGKFENHYDLASYLYKNVAHGVGSGAIDIGKTDTLLSLLKEIGGNTVEKVKSLLERSDKQTDPRPISDLLLDVLLFEHPELSKQLVETESSIFGRNAPEYSNKNLDPYWMFLEKWIVLEKFVESIAGDTRRRVHIFSEMQAVLQGIGLSETTIYNVRILKSDRNSIVHGNLPSAFRIQIAVQDIDDILSEISAIDNPMIQKHLEIARLSIVPRVE